MKAIAGLSKEQDRDPTSTRVYCFVGKEQCSVTAAISPKGKRRSAAICTNSTLDPSSGAESTSRRSILTRVERDRSL
jgi:hypothetical protein